MIDDMPLSVRRELWGWFGEPWPSGVCIKQDEHGQDTDEWDWDMHVDTPVGEKCLWCNEEIVMGDRGQRRPLTTATGPVVTYVHRECALREVVGGLGHIHGDCSCYGRSGSDIGMSLREEALTVWETYTA